MPGLLAYQNMASASRASRAGATKVKTERAREDVPSAVTQKLHTKMGRMLSKRMASAFELPQLQARAANSEQPSITDMVKAWISRDDTERSQYQSSGSEHEPSSVCLAAMVDEFMEDQATLGKCGHARCNDVAGICKGSRGDGIPDECAINLGGELLEILKGFTACASSTERSVLADVTKAVNLVKDQAREICKEDGPDCTSGCLKRAAMRHLRDAGYNAAICKSRWDHAGGFPGGDYEYMDVLLEGKDGKTDRLMVDIDFRGQFQIARPTDRYSAILQELPHIVVGKAERLQQIVNLMCDAVKESLKKRGMPLPPWRKPDYMRAKWFSPYKRTTNDAVHPHESTESILSRELVHTAMRGLRWDSRFTNEMELQFEKAEARLSKRECPPAELVSDIRQHQERRLEDLSRTSRSRRSSEITAVTTEWKPPAVVNCRKPGRVPGLAAVLIEAGLSTLAKQQQQQKENGCRNSSLIAVS